MPCSPQQRNCGRTFDSRKKLKFFENIKKGLRRNGFLKPFAAFPFKSSKAEKMPRFSMTLFSEILIFGQINACFFGGGHLRQRYTHRAPCVRYACCVCCEFHAYINLSPVAYPLHQNLFHIRVQTPCPHPTAFIIGMSAEFCRIRCVFALPQNFDTVKISVRFD